MTQTALDSSSPAIDRLELDLTVAGRLAPLPASFLAGQHRELLAPLRFVAEPGELSPTPTERDRSDIATALTTWNLKLGHPRAAELGERLARSETPVVATGQQPGLLGGPLYSVTKALAAHRWSEELRAGSGTPGVAVFWVATEDHDFAEVSRLVLPTAKGPQRFDLGEDTAPLTPIGLRTFGPEIERLLEQLEPEFGRAPEQLARLRELYSPGQSFGEAFSRLLIDWLGDRCPLILDALDPAIKKLQQPILQELLVRGDEVSAAYSARDQEISVAGFQHQVRPQPDASPLFVVADGARRRIVWQSGERFTLRGEDRDPQPVADLLARLSDEPSSVGPGALARPLVQDLLLGTSVLILGPGEMSYLPQAASIYSLFDLAPPAVALRPQLLMLGATQARRLGELDLSLEQLLGDEFDVDRWVARAAGDDPVAAVREQTTELLAQLRQQAMAVDKGLEKPWQKTSSQIDRALEMFGGKLTASVARQHDVERRRVQDLVDTVRPLGVSQERAAVSAFFAARFGSSFAEVMAEQLDLDPTRLRAVVL